MQTRTELGRNRTGIQMSPIATSAMMDGENEFPIDSPLDRGDQQMRESYADEAEPIGSVPLPATFTGAMKSGADMLTGSKLHVLMDKLGERLAFERGGVRLYDSLLLKCRASDSGLQAKEIETLARFRDEEARHFALVAQVLRELGGDPTAQTPCADLVGVENMGFVQAMNEPRTTVLQAMHVMLDAELIDNAGWELLIELARSTGHAEVAERFGPALKQETLHLRTMRRMMKRLTLEEASLL